MKKGTKIQGSTKGEVLFLKLVEQISNDPAASASTRAVVLRLLEGFQKRRDKKTTEKLVEVSLKLREANERLVEEGLLREKAARELAQKKDELAKTAEELRLAQDALEARMEGYTDEQDEIVKSALRKENATQ